MSDVVNPRFVERAGGIEELLGLNRADTVQWHECSAGKAQPPELRRPRTR